MLWMYTFPLPTAETRLTRPQVPKRKAQLNPTTQTPTQPPQPPAQPKKFSAFSVSDSRSLENEYQKLLEATEHDQGPNTRDTRLASRKRKVDARNSSPGLSSRASHTSTDTVNVPVNEDFLFDVDIGARELGPVYWLGPIYEGISPLQTYQHQPRGC